jgi:ABC-2 type transport system ATP-binding protein
VTLPEAVVEVRGLRKVYGDLVAVDDVTFQVRRQEIFGIVGPNGAGKTTAIECIQGLRKADAGEVSVLGLDPQRDRRRLKLRIGSQLQQSALPSRLRVTEALRLYASFYPVHVPLETLIARVGLQESAHTGYGHLSGGQKQRLQVALALVNDPDVVFLDELTTGLDPQARHSMWDLVREIRDGGKTVVLTTHFMEEAERLCDLVAVIDRGRVRALDTPRELVRAYAGPERVTIRPARPISTAGIVGLPGVERAEAEGDLIHLWGRSASILTSIVGHLTSLGIELQDITTTRATLEDAFLALIDRTQED